MFIIPNFSYLIVRETSERRISQFQGFDWEWIKAARLVFEILRLPANLLDVLDGPERSIGVRAQGYGRHHFVLVGTDFLSGAAKMPFPILVSDSVTAERVEQYRSTVDSPLLHLSESRELAIHLEAAPRTAYVDEGLSRLRDSGALPLDEEDVSEIMRLIGKEIANFRGSWLRDLHLMLARITGKSVEVVEQVWRIKAYFPDALLHCQLGQSDSVYLTPTSGWWDDRLREQGFPDGTGVKT